MLTEDYCDFEIAKILKEEGFKGDGEHFYEDNKITNYINYWFRITPEERYEAIEAPTLQMAMKYLREVHNIFIQIELYSKNKDYSFELFQNTHRLMVEKREVYNSYESACESAIKYCLENLI